MIPASNPNTPYYLYPDGPVAVEARRVIGVAMAEASTAGIGRLTLTRCERTAWSGTRHGMALSTLRVPMRSGQRNLAAARTIYMVVIARAIIARRAENFDPTALPDRYQEASRALIETKMKGLTKPREVITPRPVINLMAALKRSLADETSAICATRTNKRRAKPAGDRRPALG